MSNAYKSASSASNTPFHEHAAGLRRIKGLAEALPHEPGCAEHEFGLQLSPLKNDENGEWRMESGEWGMEIGTGERIWQG